VPKNPVRKNLAHLTHCPACDDDLGVAPSPVTNGEWRPPSLLLEVTGGEAGTLDWRLSLFGHRGRSWSSADFRPGLVRWVYRLCGDGHLFLDHIRLRGGARDPEWTVHDFDVVAAIGGVAAGKSYLLLRTLSQHLTISGLEHIAGVDDMVPIDNRDADWMEEAPMRLLEDHYRQMSETGMPLPPTTRRDLLPFEFLTEKVSGDIVRQILAIHRDLVGEDHLDPTWGQRIRQPIVKRYQIGNRQVLLAIADLAGELFDQSTINDDHQKRLLRNYGTLVWVVDPVIAGPFRAFLPTKIEPTVVSASMRPDRAVHANPATVQNRRSSGQRKLATTLATVDSTFGADLGPTQYLLVCITKSDLVHLTLRSGRKLTDLGRSGRDGDVVEGAARYLLEVAHRAGKVNASLVVERAAKIAVVDPIYRARHEPTLSAAVARQLADALIEHYSTPDAFWDLTHHGNDAIVRIPEGDPSAVLPPGVLVVPSLNAHIAGSLTPGQAGVLRVRDLVMSALGCGIAFGLGFQKSIEQMLQQQWRDLRFFLCSPLASAPTQVKGDPDLIKPLDAESFPELDDDSAALTQLLLCLLRRVRP
jgi:hypothetical protein